MRVRMTGIVVIDRNPVQPGAKVGLHLLHEIADGRAMIREFDTVLGRHDEAELMAIPTAPFHKRAAILGILVGRIDLPPLPILCHAIALQIAKMRVDGLATDELPPPGSTRLGIELHDPSLDGDPP